MRTAIMTSFSVWLAIAAEPPFPCPSVRPPVPRLLTLSRPLGCPHLWRLHSRCRLLPLPPFPYRPHASELNGLKNFVFKSWLTWPYRSQAVGPSKGELARGSRAASVLLITRAISPPGAVAQHERWPRVSVPDILHCCKAGRSGVSVALAWAVFAE